MNKNLPGINISVFFSIVLLFSSGLAFAIESDDFSTDSLNPALWNFEDPLADSDVVVNGSQVLISVPAGTSHYVTDSGNFAPRLMQPASDTDFEIEVKFESTLSQQNQLQGMLAEQDADNFVQVGFLNDGSTIQALATVFINGMPSLTGNVKLNLSGSVLYMRLKRHGDTWTQSYSTDGRNWQRASTFSRALTVSSVGVFAGNAGSNPPAQTAVVDYFFNTALPIAPEDGDTFSTSVMDVTGSDNGAGPSDQPGEVDEPTATPASDVESEDRFGDINSVNNLLGGEALISDLIFESSFEGASVPQYTLNVTTAGGGQVTLNPPGGLYYQGTEVTLTAMPDAGRQFAGWSGALTGTQNPDSLVMTQNSTVQATFTTQPTPPVISNIQVSQNSTSATISWITSQPASSRVDYGETTGYELGNVSNASLVVNHNVQITGLTIGKTYHYKITSTNGDSLTATTGDNEFTISNGPSIDIWSGENQTFGDPGISQRWINILGNVSSPNTVTQLTYSLNGATAVLMGIGPDGRRLASAGDFNVDIDYANLIAGTNSVAITAQDNLGNTTLRNVSFTYSPGNTWPLPYSVNWSAVSDLGTVSQIVDGEWFIDGDALALRSSDLAYDRTLVMGDISWTDYEVRVPVTILGFSEQGYEPPNTHPAVGVVLKWPGHSRGLTTQPSANYKPQGGGAFYEIKQPNGTKGTLSITDFDKFRISDSAHILTIGVQYIWKVRVVTELDGSSTYSIKVWAASATEPVDWDLTANDTADVPGGSLILMAHFTDVRFGNVQITSLLP